MKTGLKIFIKKIIENLKDPKFIYEKINWEKFPQKTINDFFVNLKLNSIEKDLKEEEKNNNLTLSGLLEKPHPLVLKIFNRFLKYNPNNLGNWTNGKNLTGTKKIESELIKMLVDLYKADKKNIEGYITSGGTEGNIFSCWIGREYLKNKIKKGKICLLITSLTHYSVRKAGEICEIPYFLVSLNKQFSIDKNDFIERVEKLYRNGFRGFLVCLTFGYTITGTNDNIEEIDKMIKQINIKNKDIEFFVWVDGAINGWIRPFLDQNFSPFKYKSVKIFFSDFHKFGMMPYPAGFILYRKELRKLIEKEIPYLEEKDNTLLGSRQGVVSLAFWYLIQKLGINGFKNIYRKLLEKRNKFLKEKLKNYKNIGDELSLIIAIIKNNRKLINGRKTKIKILINKKEKKHVFYTFYFLK